MYIFRSCTPLLLFLHVFVIFNLYWTDDNKIYFRLFYLLDGCKLTTVDPPPPPPRKENTWRSGVRSAMRADPPDMTIAVDWDVKNQTKQNQV